MRKHKSRVWLVNTGWGGGGYGVGKRISLKHTRAIIDAIHGGFLRRPKTERDPVFGFDIIRAFQSPFEDFVPPGSMGGQVRLRGNSQEARRTL